ncbi:MAG: DUF4105 domain-containing protein [Cyclobacteriaceae bacterium]|nr:DUF4105 domain-containing protein [Cyclobacteriaceae bacterium HetDA_MAG_MS6]
MNFRIAIFGFFVAVANLAQSQAPQLSEKAEIRIMTLGPYQAELYSAFGHSAIRVYDPGTNIDWVYHYGVFDFNQKNFYWNFARGKMLYRIGRTRYYSRFRDAYIAENRFIYEQILNLTPSENQLFFNYLENNYLPENRDYLYNYVYDNCATKIRDVVEDVIPDTIHYDYSYAKDNFTIRDLMDLYLEQQYWGDLAIDLGLGLQIDQEAPGYDYMFLPDFIQTAFDQATILRPTGAEPLIRETIPVYKATAEESASNFFTPLNTFVLLFFIVGFITNKNFKTGKRTHWIDVILFTIVGIFGWWFVFLWAGTEHLSKYNWNLIWAFPFHLPFVFLLHNEKLKPFLTRYFRFTGVVYALVLVFWALIPQSLHQSLIPLLVTLILRALYISYDLGRIRINQ